MKKTLLLLSLILFSFGQAQAFQDLSPNASYYEAVQNLLDRGILDKGSFFRADEPVPHIMFWPAVLRDGEVNIYEDKTETPAEEDMPFGSNIVKRNDNQPYIDYAIRKDFIDAEDDLLLPISKIDALKGIITSKKIAPAKRISPEFREKYGKALAQAGVQHNEMKYVEAALAANIMSEKDVELFQLPFHRADLAQWLYNYHTNGIKKNRISGDNPEINPTIEFRTKPTIKSDKKPQVKIEILQPGERQKTSTPKPARKLPDEDVLKKVFDDILLRYRFSEDINLDKKKEMINSGIAGLLKPLGDKYSRYIVPKKADEYLNGLEGQFEGIGAFVDIENDHFVITAPIEGSPADKAGLQPGDIVIQVDGNSIIGKTLQESVALIKGPAGTDVELKIIRNGVTVVVKVTRGKIDVPSLEFAVKQSVPVVKIRNFDSTTAADFEKLINTGKISANGRGLIIDLRNNPGGLLETALKLLENFFAKDDVLLQYDEKQGIKRVVSGKDGALRDLSNIVFLLNNGSASASEVFAGAILEQKEKAMSFGLPTVGKGTVQSILRYANGGVLKITVAKWLTPNGEWLHKKGITPDEKFENVTPEERQSGIDKALDRAIRYVLDN